MPRLLDVEEKEFRHAEDETASMLCFLSINEALMLIWKPVMLRGELRDRIAS